VARAQSAGQLGGGRGGGNIGDGAKLGPGSVGAQVLEVVEGIAAGQHRLGQRHQQLPGAGPRAGAA
jgi:hypothetical protein